MIRIIKIIFALSVIGSLILFIAHTDLKLVKLSLLKIKWKFAWLLIITCAAYFLGTLAWKLCLGHERKFVDVFSLYWIRLISETVAMFNPSSIVGGDLVKIEIAIIKTVVVGLEYQFTTASIKNFINRFTIIVQV